MTARPWVFIGLVAAEIVLSVSVSVGVFANVLFLIFSGMCSVVLALAAPNCTRAHLIALIVLPIVLLGRSEVPYPISITRFRSQWVSLPSTSLSAWHYTFARADFEKELSRCGLSEVRLTIDGARLERAQVTVNGRAVTDMRISKLYSEQRMVRVIADLPPVLDVAISSSVTDGSEGAGLFNGPQFHSGHFYPEAVYLVAENDQCRLVVYARRACEKGGEGERSDISRTEWCPETIANFYDPGL